jgi:GT2 family glycosyltransferase
MVSDLSVIILNWHEEQQTLRCLAVLRRWETLKPAIIVVDNESSERSRAILGDALAPDALISSQANLGYAGGNNLGIARASQSGSPYFLLLNNDAVIEETDMVRLIDRLRDHPGIAVIGPVLHERQQDGVQCSIGGRDIAQGVLTREVAKPEDLPGLPSYPLADVDYVPGTVFLARRSLFEQIGCLDENFFFSGEIADFCRRARDAGHRVCVDLEAAARHDAGDSSLPLRDTLYVYYSLRNRFLYANKHYCSQRLKYLARWSGLCLVELCRALATGRWRKARAILLAAAHGSTGRFGNRNGAFL